MESSDWERAKGMTWIFGERAEVDEKRCMGERRRDAGGRVDRSMMGDLCISCDYPPLVASRVMILYVML